MWLGDIFNRITNCVQRRRHQRRLQAWARNAPAYLPPPYNGWGGSHLGPPAGANWEGGYTSADGRRCRLGPVRGLA
jgi:hypothetical protein